MQVTDVRVFVRGEAKLKAYVSVTFDDCFVVRDIKVIEGNDRLFIAMPSRKLPDGTYKDLAHPLNTDTRRMIEERVIEAYKKAAAEGPAPSQGRRRAPKAEDGAPAPSEDGAVPAETRPAEKRARNQDGPLSLGEEIEKSIEEKFSL